MNDWLGGRRCSLLLLLLIDHGRLSLHLAPSRSTSRASRSAFLLPDIITRSRASFDFSTSHVRERARRRLRWTGKGNYFIDREDVGIAVVTTYIFVGVVSELGLSCSAPFFGACGF